MNPRVATVEPRRTWARPGTTLPVTVHVRGGAPGISTVRLALVDVAREAWSGARRVRLASPETAVRLAVRLPAAARRGYALRATVSGAWGTSPAASTVVEAIDGWWEAPRHVALTDFRPGLDAAAAVAGLRPWHVTVAQAYDWMYRHYRYAAPEEPFLDALGRRVSHGAVRALVREGHRAGIATLAYGSVYGAEPEYVDRHPDERVFDADGQPLSLGGAFFINDLRPGRPWRARLLREYTAACRSFGFDGIHMDTYGPPHEAQSADGEAIRFAELYPGLIADAAAAVAATGADHRVLFNCVEGFPIDAIAGERTAAHYLELWPPDDRYADVVRWIDRARAAGRGRPVVIAAYVPALRDAGDDPDARAAAVETAVLLSTVIQAAGAFHHVIAEGDRLLVEGYYPAAVRLRSREAALLRAAWTFGARYLHLLSDPTAVPDDGALPTLRVDGTVVPVTATPEAGSLWARATRTPDGRVLSLVDLRGTDDRWTAPRRAAEMASGWTLEWAAAHAPLAMSPWSGGGEPVPLRPAATRAVDARGGRPPATSWRLPSFRRWLVIHDPG